VSARGIAIRYKLQLEMASLNRYEALNTALRINAGKSTRAEDLEDYDEFFVDTIDSAVLEANTNQLIFGRRGSGKTLLLGTLNERIQGQFPNTNMISFYYDATQFRSSAEYSSSSGKSVKEQTHAFFNSFIERLGHDIFDLASKILERPHWLDAMTLSGGQHAARRRRLDSLVGDLLDASGYGTEGPRLSQMPSRREETIEQFDTRRLGGGASLGVDLAGSNTTLGASAAANRAWARDRKVVSTNVKMSTPHFKPYRVRELLVEIIDLLGLDYIILFIDEWMSLAECQVEFAHRLKECFFGDSRIAVKIAADQYQGKFHNGGQGHNLRGIEVGADIFVAVDLDRPFREPERTTELFTEALYRRLSYFEDDVERHFGRPPLSNPGRFRETLFSTPQAFVELCLGAQGLCREFHLLFKQCAKDMGGAVSTTERIDFETVRRALVEFTAQTYGRAKEGMDSNILLFNIINPHIRDTESRFFIIESRPNATTAVVNDLLSKRVIHRVPDTALHSSIRGMYDCFEIAYGIYIDLMRATEYATGKTIEDSQGIEDVSLINESNKMSYLLDLSPLTRAGDNDVALLLCPHCQREFYSNEPAFEARKICPYCFQDQPIGDADE